MWRQTRADKPMRKEDNQPPGWNGSRWMTLFFLEFGCCGSPFYQSVVHSSSKSSRNVETAGTSMSAKHYRRKPDLFSILVLAVALGMTVTLAYQVNVYYGADQVPIAEQISSTRAVGG